MELKFIADLVEKVKSGEIDESKLIIQLDNDRTQFIIYEENGEEEAIDINEGGGYYDVLPLYKILFPKAKDIDWV